MSDLQFEHKQISGCSRYWISYSGLVTMDAYIESVTGRYIPAAVVKPYRIGNNDEDVCIKLLTDQNEEISKPLYLIIHDEFPSISIEKCKQWCVMRYDAMCKEFKTHVLN